jgi:sugar lactone lactonase YvrE
MSADGTMYVGSIVSGTIYRATAPGEQAVAEPWSVGQLAMGAVGMKVDDARGLLVVCDASPLAPTESSLVVLDLATGLRLAAHPLQPGVEGDPVLCNDVVIDDSGGVLLTDTMGARILRVPADEVAMDGTPARPWFESELFAAVGEPPFGVNGIARVGGDVYVVNFNQGTLIRVDRDASGQPTGGSVVALTGPDGTPTHLVGPDGLAVSRDGTLLVVESALFSAEDGDRLSEITVTPSGATVAVVEEGYDAPTTCAEGPRFTWVVEGQLDHFVGIDPAEPSPFRVTGVLRR